MAMVSQAVALIGIIRVDPPKNYITCTIYNALHSNDSRHASALDTWSWLCLRLVALRRCGLESEDPPSELKADTITWA